MNAARVLVYVHCTHFPLLTVQGVGMCENELREKARKEKATSFLYVRSHSYNLYKNYDPLFLYWKMEMAKLLTYLI